MVLPDPLDLLAPMVLPDPRGPREFRDLMVFRDRKDRKDHRVPLDLRDLA